MATIDERAEGKTVVTVDGSEVGTAVDADNATAYVELDLDLTDEIAAELGWGDADEETSQLDTDAVESVTDDEIRSILLLSPLLDHQYLSRRPVPSKFGSPRRSSPQ